MCVDRICIPKEMTSLPHDLPLANRASRSTAPDLGILGLYKGGDTPPHLLTRIIAPFAFTPVSRQIVHSLRGSVEFHSLRYTRSTTAHQPCLHPPLPYTIAKNTSYASSDPQPGSILQRQPSTPQQTLATPPTPQPPSTAALQSPTLRGSPRALHSTTHGICALLTTPPLASALPPPTAFLP